LSPGDIGDRTAVHGPAGWNGWLLPGWWGATGLELGGRCTPGTEGDGERCSAGADEGDADGGQASHGAYNGSVHDDLPASVEAACLDEGPSRMMAIQLISPGQLRVADVSERAPLGLGDVGLIAAIAVVVLGMVAVAIKTLEL